MRQRTLEVLGNILSQAKRDGLNVMPLDRAVESLKHIETDNATTPNFG
jgi:hypothetical protein